MNIETSGEVLRIANSGISVKNCPFFDSAIWTYNYFWSKFWWFYIFVKRAYLEEWSHPMPVVFVHFSSRGSFCLALVDCYYRAHTLCPINNWKSLVFGATGKARNKLPTQQLNLWHDLSRRQHAILKLSFNLIGFRIQFFEHFFHLDLRPWRRILIVWNSKSSN